MHRLLLVLTALSFLLFQSGLVAAAAQSTPVLNPALPNVLILGDSISIGYTPLVREGLKDRANVLRPNANCGDTRSGLANLEKWLGDTPWHVIHFNWGLHDLCYRDPSKVRGNRDKVKGRLSVSLPDYEKNLETLVLRLKKTGATLIWASTAVVPEGEAGRFVGDDLKYNAVAASLMRKHGVLVNDLHATTKTFAPEMFTGLGDVHFTPEGYARLAARVVASATGVLTPQPRR